MIFAYAKTKMQISCAVTAQPISAFVFVTRIVQFLFYLNPKFQDSSFFSVTVQTSLCQTRLETPKTVFLASRVLKQKLCCAIGESVIDAKLEMNKR